MYFGMWQKLSKYNAVWQSYCKNKRVQFILPQCISVSCIVSETLCVKFGLGVVQDNWKWYHSKAWIPYSHSIVTKSILYHFRHKARSKTRFYRSLSIAPTTPGGSHMTASLGGRYDPWPVKRSTDWLTDWLKGKGKGKGKMSVRPSNPSICPLCLRLSVTRHYSVETAKHILKLFHHRVATQF